MIKILFQEEVCLGNFKSYKSYKANLEGDIWTYNFLLFLHSFSFFHTLFKKYFLKSENHLSRKFNLQFSKV